MLQRHALSNNAAGTSRTFVTTDEARVVGFYALATSAVQRTQASVRVGRGQPATVPVILLARLGVDRCVQADESAVSCSETRSPGQSSGEQVGVRALLVHAMHERARQFYLQDDFEPSPTDPLHLLLLMKDARESGVTRSPLPA